jgi:hypothetical protein
MPYVKVAKSVSNVHRYRDLNSIGVIAVDFEKQETSEEINKFFFGLFPRKDIKIIQKQIVNLDTIAERLRVIPLVGEPIQRSDDWMLYSMFVGADERHIYYEKESVMPPIFDRVIVVHNGYDFVAEQNKAIIRDCQKP